MIWRRAWIPLVLALLLAAAVAASAQERESVSGDDDRPLTLTEIRALVARAIANQHADDRVLNEYDRTEHTIQQEGGKEASTTDAVERVFPTGTGDVRIALNRNGKPIDAMTIEEQWQSIEKALAARSDPSDPAIRDEFAREQHRELGHFEMIDAVGKAFDFSWQGRTTLNGRRMIELRFEPNRNYRSSARWAILFAHMVGTIWLDESSGQVARIEMELRDDVSFGGGIIGKVYHGSWIKIAQSEVAPGVWLPTLATYDVEGRKFVFPAGWRGQIDATGYRHVGPPAEALLVVQREHGGALASER